MVKIWTPTGEINVEEPLEDRIRRECVKEEDIIETPRKTIYVDWRRAFDALQCMSEIWQESLPFEEELTLTPEAEFKDKPILLSLSADWHVGSTDTDYDQLRKDLNLVTSTPNVFMGTLGDDVDVGMYCEVRFMQAGPIRIQRYSVEKIAEELTECNPRHRKIWLFACAGNHTVTLFERAGELYEEVYKNFDIRILPGMGKITMHVGDQTYKIAVAHKHFGQSRLNITLAAKRIIEFYWDEADIGAVAHMHHSAYEKYYKAGRERLAMRPGTYRTENNLFELARGWGRSQPGGACVILYPDQHKMIPFDNLEEGIEYLNYLNKPQELH